VPGRLVADHRIALVYECRDARGDAAAALAATRFQDARDGLLAIGLCAPARLDPGHQRSLGGRPLWVRQAGALSADLHPAVRSAFAGVEGTEPAWLRLSDHGRNLLAGLYRADSNDAASKDALRLALTPAAQRRLGDRLGGATAVPVAVEDVTYHAFRTGLALVVVLLKLMPAQGGIDADVLTEAMPVLSDNRRDPSLFFGDGTPADARFQFGTVVGALLDAVGLTFERRHRVHSYATLVFADDLPPVEARDLAHRLSRHYSLAYAPPPDHAGTELLQPFANVLHAASLEGAATIVTMGGGGAATMPVEFLRDWLATAFRPTYLPIHLLAYHEHLALLDLAQASAVDIDVDRFSDVEVGALRRLTTRFLAFRLRYRVAQPSRITMHNQFHEALRRALGMQALAEKVARDVTEVEFRLTQIMRDRDEKAQAALAEEARKRRELEEEQSRVRKRRWRFYAPIASLCVAFVTMLNFLEKAKAILAELLSDGAKSDVAARIKLTVNSTTLQSWIIEHGGATLSLFFSVVFALIAYKFARAHEEGAAHVAKEAEEETQKEIVFEAGHAQHDVPGPKSDGAGSAARNDHGEEDRGADEREKQKIAERHAGQPSPR